MGATTTLDLQPSEFCFPMKWLLPCLHHASMSLTASCWGTIQMKIVWPSGNMVPIWTLGQNTRSIPIISDGNWEKLIGIHIHGDGWEFYKEDEYFVWSWSSKFLHWRIHQGRSHESFPHRCDSWKMDEKISCYSPCLRFCVLWFFTIVPIIWPEIEKTVYTLPHFSLPRNHRFETRCTNASQNWLHGQWILQAKANGLTMGSEGKHSVQGQLASNKGAKIWPTGGGFPAPYYYKTFLCCFPRNAMAHLMWESMVSLVKYLPWWFTMGGGFYPDQTCLQFCGLVADLRACYVSFKADLKARHQMHNLQRWYKCNLFLG